jgi:hypothetical protein
VKQNKGTARSIVPRPVIMYAGVGLGVGAILIGAACSSSNGGSGSSESSSSSGSGGAGSGSSSGSSSGAPSGEGGSVAQDATPGDAGTLILQAFGGASGEVAAQVPLLEPGVGQQRTCTGPLDGGACQLTSCQLGGIGSPGPGYGNFGPISASVGTTTVPLTYDGTGYGAVYFPSSITLGTGGTMTFHGGDAAGVPTFDVSATIPGLAVITSPVPKTDGGAAIIDTSQDLSVTWLPISIGQIQFGLNGGSSSVAGVAISVACTFEGASGSGTVPHTLLSSLKEMSGTTPTYAGLSSELEATTVVDGLTIVTQSYQNSPTTGRDFNVTLQ